LPQLELPLKVIRTLCREKKNPGFAGFHQEKSGFNSIEATNTRIEPTKNMSFPNKNDLHNLIYGFIQET
jgi:hypothetical protein